MKEIATRVARAALAVLAAVVACSPATPRDVVPETHDSRITEDAQAPASGGYAYVARRPHGVIGLGGARQIDADEARRLVDRLADELDACARGLEEQRTLVSGAARLVVAGLPRGAEVTDLQLESGDAVAKNALLCVVAPARALVFPPPSDAGVPSIYVEVLWNHVQSGKATATRDAGAL